MKKNLFTGGGTAGHITPNVALIEELVESECAIFYIGQNNSMEKALISKLSIPFYNISAGKFRRYWS